MGRTRRAIERQVRERGERGEGRDSMGGRSTTIIMSTLLLLPLLPPPNMQQSTNDEVAGNGGVGEGGREEGEDGGGGRSTMKPVSLTKQSANDGGDKQRGRVEAAGD
jgi:hypothetical protein